VPGNCENSGGEETEDVLERLSLSTWVAQGHRLTAAEMLAAVDQIRALRACSAIVHDTRVDDRTRMAAGDIVRQFSAYQALLLYLALCQSAADVSVRIVAGSQAGEINSSQGIHALAQLANTSGGFPYRDEIARAMVNLDKPEAIEEWQTWLTRRLGPSTVIEDATRNDEPSDENENNRSGELSLSWA
jgi:hypothetical protein